MSRAEEDDDEHKEDDSSEEDNLPSGIETITKNDIRSLVSGITRMVGDFESMKEKQKQFEENCWELRYQEKHQLKKSSQKAKLKASQNLAKTREARILQTAAVAMMILLLAVLYLLLKMVPILFWIRTTYLPKRLEINLKRRTSFNLLIR